MSQTVNVNGVSINYPETGDTGWGDEGTAFAVQTSSALSKLGLSTGTTVDIPGTLDVTGVTTLDSNLSVGGNSTVTGNSSITGNLTVNGNTTLGNSTSDTITITGSVAIDTNVLIVNPTNNRVGINKTSPSVDLDVVGNVAISGNETVGGTLGVTGNTTLSGTLGVTGNTTLSGQLLNSDGTASLPGISFSSDTNTGFYRISADKIGIATNGQRVGEIGTNYGGFTGNIIQVVTSSTSTNTSTANTAYQTTGLNCNITPKYNTSKILVMYMIGGVYNNYSGFEGVKFQLYKNGSVLNGSYEDIHAYGTYVGAKYSGFFLDSPATTSNTSYAMYYASRGGVGTVNVQFGGSFSQMILLEVQQ